MADAVHPTISTSRTTTRRRRTRSGRRIRPTSNSRSQASLSSIIHVGLVAGLFVLVMLDSWSVDDKSSVPISLVDMGGFDDEGDGSSGSGGEINPLAVGTAVPTPEDYAALPLNATLPQIKHDFQKRIALEDPLGQVSAVRREGGRARPAQRGDPRQAARLSPGQWRRGRQRRHRPGRGRPRRLRSDETRARGLRWVIRFRTTSGQDYLEQLRSLGAIVVVPTPPDFKTRMYIFRDLNNPTPGVVIQPADWDELSDQIRFCDLKETSGRQISTVLNLPYTAPYFWAFFPKGLEDELARKETAYQNRRAEDIEETVFQAVQRGGQFELDIVRQTVKR